jgi:fibronectin type 3 domain-containing protein
MKAKPFLAILLILSLLVSHCGGGAGAGSDGVAGGAEGKIGLTWDASTDQRVTGYLVYYGMASGNYEYRADAKMGTPVSGGGISYTLTGLTSGQTYYIAVTAYDNDQDESDLSNEVSGIAK